jgi:hypothetical protein
MASLAGALTTLGLAGLSTAAPVFDAEYATSPKPYTVTFTQLGLSGLSELRHVDYTGKTTLTDSFFSVSDTTSITVTESPVDSQEITTYDLTRLSVSDIAALFNSLAVTDTARIGLSESIALTVAGVADKPVSDTTSLTLSAETAVLDVTLDVTDTASLTLSGETATVVVSVEQVIVSDTASLSIPSEEALLNIFTGVNVIDRADTTSLRIGSEIASVREIGFVTRIEIEIENPLRIELEME